MEDVEFVKRQNEINMALANKLAEEVAALNKKAEALKRVRITSICCFGTGLILVGASKIPGIDENWQQGLFISGASLGASGLLTFGFSFTIPF